MEALGNLGINLSYLVVQILNFFIVMLLLSAWAYKPIVKILDERSAKIAQSLEDAREAAEARDNANSEAEKIISCLLYTSPSPRDGLLSRMPSSA